MTISLALCLTVLSCDRDQYIRPRPLYNLDKFELEGLSSSALSHFKANYRTPLFQIPEDICANERVFQ